MCANEHNSPPYSLLGTNFWCWLEHLSRRKFFQLMYLYHSVVMVLFRSLNILSPHLLAKCCFPRALRKACAVLKSIHWNNISQSVYRLSYPQELLSNYNSFFAALFHFLHFAHTSINVFSFLCSLKQVYTNWHVPF